MRPAADNTTARPSRRGAFTLIEMLTVTAILALLIGLVVPSLLSARRHARVVVCGTNLRCIGVGWQFYFVDNDGFFPTYKGNMQWFYGGNESSVLTPSGFAANYRPLNPYMGKKLQQEKTAEFFRCTEDGPIRNPAGQPTETRGYTTYEYYGNSYLLNHVLLRTWDRKTGAPLEGAFNRADVTIADSRVILAGDCQWCYGVWGSSYSAHFHNDQDRVNLLFLDGHAAFIQLARGQAATADYSMIPWDVPYGQPEKQ